MRLASADLARLCYNAIQFSAKDSSLGGVVCFRPGNDFLSVYASDDYVAMVDSAPADPSAPDLIHLGLKEVKELEKDLRAAEGEVEMAVVVEDEETNLNALINGIDHYYPVVADPPDFSPVVDVVHSAPRLWPAGHPAQPFAVRAERFSKFRLLRTPESPSCADGYPADLLWDNDLLRVKVGPYLRAVIAPLARETFESYGGTSTVGIQDLYAEEPNVLWVRQPAGLLS
jgi:hypothetical protein